jgi:hypothetical protein
MQNTRRSFMTGMLAAAAAPVFVRSDSLMRLWVPKRREALVLLPRADFGDPGNPLVRFHSGAQGHTKKLLMTMELPHNWMELRG